jgi:hypothetical protein
MKEIDMRNVLKLGAVLVVLGLVATACGGKKEAPSEEEATDAAWSALNEGQAIDAAWNAFKPNTSSRDLANWEVVEVRQVLGREVSEAFEGEAAPGCWVGPTPPPNREIQPSGTYWYVHMKARPATPVPPTGTVPPTAPPVIPEAQVREAEYLLDSADGQVVARHIYCVIY